MDRFVVDIDNHAYTPAVDPITAHSRIAEYYRFRPPYLEQFFAIAADKLALDTRTTLMDLCCGRGELASQLAGYSQRVIAIDGSQAMLDHRIQRDNVEYLLHDVNAAALPIAEQVDHLVIGSAIHWIAGSALKSIIERSLRGGGSVLVTHTTLDLQGQNYGPALRALNGRFGRSINPNVDFWGDAKLLDCGFKRVDSIRVAPVVQFGLDYLFNNQLAYGYGAFYDTIVSRLAEYRAAFDMTLKPYLKQGKLSARLVNWGVIYSSGSPR